jgi:hypothetical protein
VTTGSTHECTVFQDRVDFITGHLGLKPKEWLADRGYGHGPAYEFLRAKKICAYIPLRDKKLGRGKHSPPEGFRFDRKSNRYICPQGHEMLPHARESGYQRYVIKNGACKTCPLRASCMGDSKLKSRRVSRSHYQDEFDALHRRSSTKHFRSKRKERSARIEGVFGEGKENHCLDRAIYRGRAKMQIQAYMIAIVHNLKRLASGTLDGAFWLVMRLGIAMARLKRIETLLSGGVLLAA